MKKSDFYDLLKFIPKAEIHIHEEAVLSDKTIKTVYKRSFGKEISKKEFDDLFDYNDLTGFLDSFIKIQKFFTNIEDLTFLFNDFSDYLEENNIVYCEAFVSPTSHLRKGWDFNQMMKLIDESLAKTKKEKNRIVKILIDVSRSFGLENAMNNLDLVLNAKDKNILGIGLGGDEKKGPAKDYAKVFDKAVENGLKVVAHAGETCPSWSIKDALNLLHAQRIGHGITAADDEELIAELKKSKIPLEVCVTSNTFTKVVDEIKNHPIRKLYDAGCMVTLNTDDPTFFKVSLIDEYWRLYKELNFTLEEIKQIIKNAYLASFLSKKAKKEYCDQVDAKWDEWFKAHPDCK